MSRKRNGFMVWVILTGLLLAIVAGFFVWRMRKHEREKIEKENGRVFCRSNMRKITGSIEMYNMDNKKKMTTKLDLTLLKEKSYLASMPVCFEKGEYSIKGDYENNGLIVCSAHGSAND